MTNKSQNRHKQTKETAAFIEINISLDSKAPGVLNFTVVRKSKLGSLLNYGINMNYQSERKRVNHTKKFANFRGGPLNCKSLGLRLVTNFLSFK